MLSRNFLLPLLFLGVVLAFVPGAQAAPSVPVVPYKDLSFAAQVLTADQTLVLSPGETGQVTVELRNAGSKTWEVTGKQYVSLYTVGPSYRSSVFANQEWSAPDQPVRLTQKVLPKQAGTMVISFTAPQKPGEYVEDFQLAVENKTWIKGGSVRVVVQVKTDEGGAAPLTTPTTTSVVFANEQLDMHSPERSLIDEPSIRVGLYKTKEMVRFQSPFAYDVYLGNELQGSLSENTVAELSYADGVYRLTGEGLDFSGRTYLRLVPYDPDSYFVLPGYTRTATGKKSNFNAYRGGLEYRFSPKSGEPYVVNVLPLEQYLAGVAETHNDAAMEYIKALMVAARSYAFTHISTVPPTDKRLFDVYPTTADQLYLGYNFEKTAPRIVRAVAETRGEMVTYKGKPVTTYYFGNSDGKTRSWQSFSKVEQPWLQSVAAPYDKGKKLWGHGVGMSCQDAAMRATKEGWDYQHILTYYYTNVAVEKVF